VIIGRKAIAHELGCSTKTVTRLYRAGQLPKVFKIAGSTSPLKITVKDLQKLRQSKGL
jgi:hypothetical protein